MEELTHKMGELDHTSNEYAQVADRYQRISGEFRVNDGYALDSQVGTVLDGLGFRKEDWTRYTEEFSGGWQMRIALAKLLLSKPNLLLLDEPTNHLDLETRNWLEQYLLAVSLRLRADLARPLFPRRHRRPHRRDLEQAACTSTAATTKSICSRSRSAATRWSPPTRTSASASSSSRPSSTAFATRPPKPSRCRAASRSWRRSSASRFRRTRRPSTSASRSRSPAGGWWSSATDVAKSYGPKEVFRDVNFTIQRGDRIALVGVNGAGKSTLIKLLAGIEPLTEGTLNLGHNVEPDYFAQDQYKELDPAQPHARRSFRCRAAEIDDRAARRAGLLPVLRRRCLQAHRRALRRRAQPLRAGAHAAASLEFPAARRAHQPPRHARQGRAAGVAGEVQRHGGLRLARSLLHRQAGHARLRDRRRPRRSLSRQLRRLSLAQAARAVRRERLPEHGSRGLPHCQMCPAMQSRSRSRRSASIPSS